MINYIKYENGIEANFKSDGCTFAPDGSWGSCCLMHDHAKKNKFVSAKDADGMLYDCMKDRANIFLAIPYWIAVRFRSITGISPSGIALLVVFLSGIGLLMKYGG